MTTPTIGTDMATKTDSEIQFNDIVVSVTDERPEPRRWRVIDVHGGFITAEAIKEHVPGTHHTPVIAIYKADQWKKVD